MTEPGVVVILSNNRGGIAKHMSLVAGVLPLESHDLESHGNVLAKIRAVRRILRARKLSRVVTHGVAAGIAVRLRARRDRHLAHVEVWHGDPFFKAPRARRVFKVLARLGRAPHVQVFVNGSLLPAYADRQSRYQVLPNAIPEVEAALGSPRPRRAVFVGRYSHEKGLSDLLQAWKLAAIDETWQLETFGEGPSTPQAVTGVQVHGPTPDPLGEMARADIVIIPSHIECSPYVALEAMEAGCMMVVTSTGDMPDLVQGSGCGRVVPPEDVPALAEALSEAVRLDPDVRRDLGAAGRAHLREVRPYESWATQVAALYRVSAL